MGILEKTVWIKLRGRNISDYENIGYEIPRIINKNGKLVIPSDAQIEVKVSDLPVRSEARVTKICDYCGKHVYNQLFKDITTQRERTNGVDCCLECRTNKVQKTHASKPIPFDASLAGKFPAIASEWNKELNSKAPHEVRAFSQKKAWWNCSTNPNHIYEAIISNRTNVGSRCPYCVGKAVNEENCLAAKCPELMDEWHPTLNELTPYDYSYGSNKSAWWMCSRNTDHVWYGMIANRSLRGYGCLQCYLENNVGRSNGNWRGGKTSLIYFLRYNTFKWVSRCLEKYENKCFVTGETGSLDVHHTIPFNLIKNIIMNEYNLPEYATVGEYSQEQLTLMSKEIRKHHDDIEGIPLLRSIHKLFHSVYGNDEGITLDNLYKFKERYLSGEFS